MSSFIIRNITFSEIYEIFTEVIEEYKDYNKSIEELYFIFRTRLNDKYLMTEEEEKKFIDFFEKYISNHK